VARLAVRHRDEGVVAFGMGGDELAVPAEEFRAVYDFARSHGLVNMRRRLQESGGRCIIESVPGGGTRVRFEVNLHS